MIQREDVGKASIELQDMVNVHTTIKEWTLDNERVQAIKIASDVLNLYLSASEGMPPQRKLEPICQSCGVDPNRTWNAAVNTCTARLAAKLVGLETVLAESYGTLSDMTISPFQRIGIEKTADAIREHITGGNMKPTDNP